MEDVTFKSKLLCKNTWVINGVGCNSYLLVGNRRGLVINTGYATENIREYAQTLTNKTVDIAANTHGEFDHTGGNGYFEYVYMSAKALETAKKPYLTLDSTKYPLDYTVVIIGNGDIIDLGGRIIEVIETHELLPFSIAFLDRKEKLTFTSNTNEPQKIREKDFK